MSINPFEKMTSEVFAVLSNPFRIQIALALFGQEACVCHLEQMLKKRQAFISQHLMVMRDAGLLDTRREGKYIYYRLSDKESILDLIRQAAKIAGLDPQKIPSIPIQQAISQCACPKCETDINPVKVPQSILNAGTSLMQGE